jgi:hypothetical protein
MDVAVVGETIFRSHTLRLLRRGKVVFLWGAVPIVFGISEWQVYSSEEVANAIFTKTLFRGGFVGRLLSCWMNQSVGLGFTKSVAFVLFIHDTLDKVMQK